jgi:preprotein translocase subunit SecY
MNETLRYRAFIATLISLVSMFMAACFLAWVGRSVEAIGIGGALTGLIGLAGVLAGAKPHSDEVKVTNRPEEAVPVEPAP